MKLWLNMIVLLTGIWLAGCKASSINVTARKATTTTEEESPEPEEKLEGVISELTLTTEDDTASISWEANLTYDLAKIVLSTTGTPDCSQTPKVSANGGVKQSTITGLKTDKKYYYAICLQDAENKLVARSTGSFVTKTYCKAKGRMSKTPFANSDVPGVDGSTEAKALHICTPDQMLQISADTDLLDKYFLLKADLDFENVTYTMIGDSSNPFIGTFDGAGHAIENLTLDESATSKVGIFGETDDGTIIQNLHLENVSITGDDKVGGLIGNHDLGTLFLQNISSKNLAVQGNENVGGLVGSAGNSAKVELYFLNIDTVITAANFSGGLFGYINLIDVYGVKLEASVTCSATSAYCGGMTYYQYKGELENITSNTVVKCDSSTSGACGGLVSYGGRGFLKNIKLDTTVTSTGANAGGLYGEAADKSYLNDIYITGSVAGVDNVGGLVGENGYTTYAMHVHFDGNVSGTNAVGGLAGYVTYNLFVKYASVQGQVQGTNRVGGLIGHMWNGNWSIDESLSKASVSGTDSVAGMIGMLEDNGSITESFYDGVITGSTKVGGIVGNLVETYGTYASDIFSNNYWSTSGSNPTLAIGAGDVGAIGNVAGEMEGKTIAQLRSQATFINYDFTYLLDIEEGISSPTMQATYDLTNEHVAAPASSATCAQADMGYSAGQPNALATKAEDFDNDGTPDLLFWRTGVLNVRSSSDLSLISEFTDLTTTSASLRNASWINFDGNSNWDILHSDWSYNSSRGVLQVNSGVDGSSLFSQQGPSTNFLVGYFLANAGDVNNDGVPDILSKNSWENSGNVIVYSGSNGAALMTKTAENSTDNFGRQLAGIGDIDGDFYDDVMISAPGFDNDKGKVYIYSGQTGTLLQSFVGERQDSLLGSYAIGTLGDLNADARPDFFIQGNVAGHGKVYVYSGSDFSLLKAFTATERHTNFGQGVSAGDYNSDGKNDILITEPNFSGKTGIKAGKLYIYSGADFKLLVALEGDRETTGLNIGHTVAHTPQSCGGSGRGVTTLSELGKINSF